MSDTTKIYPAWQQTIREAQKVQAARDAEYASKQEVVRIEAERKEGEDLGFVLNLLGIEAKPVTSRYELDGFNFSLINSRGYEDYGLRGLQRHGGDMVIFELRVSVTRGEEYKSRTVYVNSWKVVSSDWTAERAELASAIDDLTSWRNTPASPTSDVKPFAPTPTIAEQLEALIRQIVAGEMPANREY